MELNHLELQFLLLNDFRLAVPVEELEAYGTMLVSFYAREAVTNANLSGGLISPATTEPDRIARVPNGNSDRRIEGPASVASSVTVTDG